MFNNIKYKEIKETIEVSGKKTQIIAISKNHPKEAVEEAISYGVRIFGENRVQEAAKKFSNLIQVYNDIELHLTGPLQTNKVKQAMNFFKVFHTLDRERLAKEFVKQNLFKKKKFFIQVNTGEELSKNGIYIDQLTNFFNYCKFDLGLNIIGLMCIPPVEDDPNKHFSILQKKADTLMLSNLSIGMSNDYKEAIMYNARYIRIGTALFGTR